MCGGRNQDLAAHMAALLLRRELVLEMNARGSGLDISARDLVRVERTAKAGFRVGHNRGKPVMPNCALGTFDLIGAHKCAVDPPAQLRPRISRIEALVGVSAAGR